MNKLELVLETVTPMFLRGAANETPELRPPAFRGLMRYWLRAMLGGIVGDDLKLLHEHEIRVFGSTEQGSPIILRISNEKEPNKSKDYILPHKNQGLRDAYKSQQQFNLTLLARPGTSPEVWQAACASLQVSLLLGGVGLRSRRGYGSLRALKSNDENLVRVFPKTFNDWETFIQSTLQSSVMRIEALVGRKTNLPDNLPKFPHIFKGSVVRLGTQGYTTSKEAMKVLMNAMPQDRYIGSVNPTRQASPLWARVINADSKYFLLLSVLPSNFSGSNYGKLKEKVESFVGKNIAIKGWNQ